MTRARKLGSKALWLCLLSLGASLSASSHDARADEPAAPSSEPAGKDEAIKAFSKARDLILAGKQTEALPLLEQSFQLLPSPNTELLMAHAHKALGHDARAAEHYERVLSSAAAEIAKGNSKYEETAAEAKRALSELSPSLGVVEIEAAEGARVSITRSSDDVVTISGSARVWAQPGTVRIGLGTPASERSVDVSAGRTTRVDMRGQASKTVDATEPAQPVPVDEGGPRLGGLGTAGIILGGVGLVGIGVFAGFGSSAQSTFDELEACGCTLAEAEALRADGKQAQLVANVSVGVGAGLLAGGVTMLIVDLVSSKPTSKGSAFRRFRPLFAVDQRQAFVAVELTSD